MTFWGIEVKPSEPFTLNCEELGGSLILTQATLGLGSSSNKSTLQVNVGDRNPIFLCTLLPGKSECFSLNLEFDEEEDVNFSVVGPTSIHLSGYVHRPEHDDEDCELDCCAEDIAETESEGSEFESEDDSEDDFIYDGEMPMHPFSSARNKGVVIEELEDDGEPVTKKSGKEQVKKKKKELPTSTAYNGKTQQQIVVKGNAGDIELESEDEDGFPISSSGIGKSRFAELQASTGCKTADKQKTKNKKDDVESASNLKRKVDAMDQDQEPKSDAKDAIDGDASEDKKKKNKKKKKKAKLEIDDTVANTEQNDDEVANGVKVEEKAEKKMSEAVKETKQSKAKPAKARTYSNGLIVEEIEMGKPNGKRASSGKKVSVRYIGKLKKTGKIFDSNTGKSPFKFRLGVQQVIKGWDVGVEGMRVGDKRRLTIPPEMGYGAEGYLDIPPNAWLVFDVELVDVA